jgi:8-amino-7-oxononanoate synthase
VPASAPLVVVASTAKALGAPLAVVAGPARLLARMREHGPARNHAGAPSAAARAALHHALARDGTEGAARRLRLATLVTQFRRALREHGIGPATRWCWPMQIVPVDASTVQATVAKLRRRGVRVVAVHRRCSAGVGLAFLLSAEHTPSDVTAVGAALAEVFAQ